MTATNKDDMSRLLYGPYDDEFQEWFFGEFKNSDLYHTKEMAGIFHGWSQTHVGGRKLGPSFPAFKTDKEEKAWYDKVFGSDPRPSWAPK